MHRAPLALSAAVLAIAARAAAEDGRRADEETELDVVPVAGGSSDIGYGGGAVGALTRFVRGDPHAWQWRLEASALITFRVLPSFGVPYQDHWIQLIVPGLLDGKLRVQARVAFTQETVISYYGLGNAAPAPANPTAPAYLYGRTHPMLEGYARGTLGPHLFEVAGGSLTLNWLDVPANGRVASDMRSASPGVRSLLGDARTHAVGILQQSLVWDSRDDEVVPRLGMWHEVDLRMSPRLGDAMPYPYCELLAIARGYVPLGDRFVIAGRALGDALFGRPPFYQLAEYDDTYAIGGSSGIRGVPAARYYGKAKLIANLEARADVARLRFVDKPWAVAVVAFFDAGRLWADWSANPGLDGTGLGLKWGTGLGLRVQQGKAFVVRGDVAWSPDALPIGAYFAAGETF